MKNNKKLIKNSVLPIIGILFVIGSLFTFYYLFQMSDYGTFSVLCDSNNNYLCTISVSYRAPANVCNEPSSPPFAITMSNDKCILVNGTFESDKNLCDISNPLNNHIKDIVVTQDSPGGASVQSFSRNCVLIVNGINSDGFTYSFKIPLITPPEQKKIYYRFSNNNCSEIQLYLNETTLNDYNTSNECNNKIIVCTEGAESCSGSDNKILTKCINNTLIQQGYVVGQCGYVNSSVITNNTTNNTNQTIIYNQTVNNYIICWKLRGFVQNAFVGENSPCYNETIFNNTCPTKYYNNETACINSLVEPKKNWLIEMWDLYGVYITIISVLLTIIISLIYLIKMFSKRR